ncbi:MAG: protein kinase [bacterium]
MIAKSISHYAIEEKIGEGGMGIVYKARDTRLLRVVAIKILPQHLVTDEKNRQRFIHEARAASALNHPNICTVYDIGQVESTHFIVMEYIDGQTLREILLDNGPLPEKEAAEICMQVCSALSGAHHKGIIHRDVKPENIIRTEGGQVKIMDFGLAKLATSEVQPYSPKKTTLQATASFENLKSSVSSFEGTALYMAPEQIEKRPVDERTDIYSLGVVLFELLTGNPPFKGTDSLSLMESILDEEPTAPSTLQGGISPSMDAIVIKALMKSPDARYQNIAEMRRELQLTASPPAKPFKQKIFSPITAFVIALLIFLIGKSFFFSKENNGPKLPHLKIQGLSLTADSDAWPVFSPSGQQIAYISTQSDANTYTQSLKIKELDTGQTRTIYEKSYDDSKPLVYGLDWSPDGRWIAVEKKNGGIGLLDISVKNTLNKLTEFGYTPKWSPDGQKIAFSSHSPFLVWENNEVWMCHLADSTLRRVSPEDHLSYDSPSWSPDSRWIICLGGVGSKKALWLLNVATGQVKQFLKLDSDIASPMWSPSGQYVYFKAQINGTTGLFRVGVDLKSVDRASEPELVIPNAEFARFNISQDGKKVIYQTGEMQEELWRIPFQRELNNPWREAELLTTHTNFTTNLAISPDGKTLALETSQGGARALVLFDPMRGNQELLYDKQDAFAPSWSPDGSWIVFDAGGGNDADIWRIQVPGGRAEKIIDHAGADWMPTYSPDGSEICFLSNRSGQFDLWMVSTIDGRTRQISNTPGTESGGYWSHDGKWIAYFRNSVSENSSSIWLYDLVKQTEHEVFRFTDNKMDILTKIVWDSDNKAIYFYDGKGLAELLLENSELSYPLDIDVYPYIYIRYALHNDQLYLIKRIFDSESIWMAEGLE